MENFVWKKSKARENASLHFRGYLKTGGKFGSFSIFHPNKILTCAMKVAKKWGLGKEIDGES